MGQAPYFPGTMTPNGSDGPAWKIPAVVGGLSGAIKGCISRFSDSGVPPVPLGDFIAGTVLYFPGTSAPSGFLVCDGAEVSQVTYAGLYAVLGGIYGAAAPGMFKLPNYGGYFLRFSDFGSGADPDFATRTNRGDGVTGSAVGTVQQHAILSHTHTVAYNNTVGDAVGTVCRGATGTPITTDGSLVGVGVENRPKNINLLPVIKT